MWIKLIDVPSIFYQTHQCTNTVHLYIWDTLNDAVVVSCLYLFRRPYTPRPVARFAVEGSRTLASLHFTPRRHAT